MHERALVSTTAVELASVIGPDRVSGVTLALSPDTEPAVVEEAWRSATSGTPMAGAVLTCVIQDHGLQCLDCGAGFPGTKLTLCPECGGIGLIVDPAPEVTLDGWVTEGAG